MPLCFAYGSNLDAVAMAARCPSSRPLGVGRLVRHRLAVMREGFLTVTPDPRRTVWGLIWDVALADMQALDRYEGVASGLYTKRHLPILAASGSRRALVYCGANAGPGIARAGYMERVLAGAESGGLPDVARAEIAALLPPGEARRGPVAALPVRPAVQPRFAAPVALEGRRRPRVSE